jgi:[acyl-carrier-protein] S-malonyltransferase
MGRDLAAEFPVAAEVFEEADDALGFSISTICFEGPEDELTRTAHTQPAILTNSIAVLRTLQKERGLTFDLAAGHSLGEFSALVAAGALRFADAVKLVHLRGAAMQEAVAEGEGAMAALIKMDLEKATALCEAVADGDVVEPANLNGGGQVVISGHAAAIDRAVERAVEFGALKAVKLQVSAPFHCSLMKPAADKLAAALESIEIARLEVPVIANVDAMANLDAERVPQLLIDQVTGAVRWDECMQGVAKEADRGFELGSGSVLRGLARRIAKDFPLETIGEPHEIRDTEI